jgi:threonine/homoserine/homoserine lactone efflux protein
MPIHLAAFVATVGLLIMLPGANNATITRQTLTYGPRAGRLTVAGTSTGILIWSLTAALGLSAILLADPHAYLAIRIAGAAILCGLGVQSLWSVRKPPAHQAAARANRRSFPIGVASSLGNPKAGVMAVSLIPQFVTAHGPVLASSIGLGALWAAMSGTWYLFYIWLVDRGRALMTRPHAQRVMQAATGITLLGLGVVVAVGT